MFTVIELQTDANGQTSAIVQTFENRNVALGRFHEILFYAANSNVKKHACALLNEDGFCEKSEHYDHE